MEELAQACSSTAVKGKTPGPDGITQEIIAKAFQAIPDTFLKVYGLLIAKGYHPKCWRQATGAILPKPGKPDYSISKAFRIISLLNCLGKVSERILAKRLSTMAENDQDQDQDQDQVLRQERDTNMEDGNASLEVSSILAMPLEQTARKNSIES